ncbi:MAG: hypothetical protein JWO58_510 [Chitinophagaceae bacterium]|nr:hypothetical protein [Chitinophagaceae bacterium]
MKKFLVYLGFFVLPIIVLGVVLEVLLRNIPNDYTYKDHYLTRQAVGVEVLFLGSSHAYYGINPVYIQRPAFNASYISQSLNYDEAILKKYGSQLPSLKYIVVPISYFTLFTTIENNSESWRVKNYVMYCGMKTSRSWMDHSELFSNTLKVNIQRIQSYYIQHKENRSCSDLGWGMDYNSSIKNNLEESGTFAAERHTVMDTACYRQNRNSLHSILTYAEQRNIKVILYTLPAYRSYVEKLNKEQLATTIETAKQFAHDYKNVEYVNFMNNPSFQQRDFFDADHLNEIGAEKLTRKIDSLINKM